MSRVWIRTISVLEIIGGVFGIGLVLWQFATAPFNLFIVTISSISTFIYAISLIAGVMLWRDYQSGRITSIIVQAIQLPKLVSPLVAFTFSFGFDAYIYWVQAEHFSNLRINLKFLAFHQIIFNAQEAPIGLGVSIPSCMFIIMLLKYNPLRSSDSPSQS